MIHLEKILFYYPNLVPNYPPERGGTHHVIKNTETEPEAGTSETTMGEDAQSWKEENS